MEEFVKEQIDMAKVPEFTPVLDPQTNELVGYSPRDWVLRPVDSRDIGRTPKIPIWDTDLKRIVAYQHNGQIERLANPKYPPTK